MVGSNKTNIGHLEGGAAMAAMVKCVLAVKGNSCCPTLHFRTLNPHLEHAAFDAIFETEGAAFHYERGHCQVSSFGFGGTNGHAVMWGQKVGPQISDYDRFVKRIKSAPPPEVRLVGDNPDDWEWDQPDTRDTKHGDRFTVTFRQDDAPDDPIVWEKH